MFPQAIEVADPVYEPTIFDPAGCPSGKACRFSDAAFAQYVGPQLSGGPYIARPSSLGTLAWNGQDDFDIAFGADPLKNTPVEKVGASTGRGVGFVAATCVTLPGKANTALLCQDLAVLAHKGGDSGAPVFTPLRGSDVVALRGLLWGGKEDGTALAAFSPISAVAFELGLADF